MADRDSQLPNPPASSQPPNPRPDRPPNQPPNQPLIVDVDAGTLLAVITVILFIPLLLTGFLSH
ncbi:MAG: hypothetical protein ACO4AI_04530 [Prochlorothrix sp.]|nr:hypothetical protein [Prochlorothrix sp.]